MARIDDRLIHGQVLVGCCEQLAVRRILLVSSDVAADKSLRDIYLSSVPSDIECRCLDAAGAARALAESQDSLPTLVVTGSPAEMLEMVEADAKLGDTICVGGLHHSASRAEELGSTGVYVGDEDLRALRALCARGLRVRIQPVPGARASELDDLLLSSDP